MVGGGGGGGGGFMVTDKLLRVLIAHKTLTHKGNC